MMRCMYSFFNETATTEIYTLSLHDALPIFTQVGLLHARVGEQLLPRARQRRPPEVDDVPVVGQRQRRERVLLHQQDRKSTRLNSSHANISYAVFCLKKIYFLTTSSSTNDT